jgi:hypothetical protein
MNDKDKMTLWLQTEIGRNKTVMNEVINIYSDIVNILEKNDMEFKYDFKIVLIKLSAYLYENSI